MAAYYGAAVHESYHEKQRGWWKSACAVRVSSPLQTIDWLAFHDRKTLAMRLYAVGIESINTSVDFVKMGE